MDPPPSPGFVEEIDFNELNFQEVVGKGSFGVVSRAIWRDKAVAVKLIETESEKKAFITELKQLSRVNHPNIVRLYGASTRVPVCLVMEYAEGGSLYNVLHGTGPQPNYTAAHAMSWLLQCARGVEYLHNMKPKALIHRDLKPPNLLLIMGGTVLKICDFGTACDIQTHMTNNKGSAAWMAPEVFEGINYSEKCDVFSWGIILWEVITRKKPFDEIGGPAFRIMWAVHNGTRPPLIRDLPKPLEILMTRCWAAKSEDRPSMAEVRYIMEYMFPFFKGAGESLVYPLSSEPEPTDYSTSYRQVGSNMYSYSLSHVLTNSNSSVAQTGESRMGTIRETVRQAMTSQHGQGDAVHFISPVQRIPPYCAPPVVVEEDNRKSQKSAPPSLAASRESLLDGRSSRSGTPVESFKRYSADFSKLEDYMIQEQGRQPAVSQRVRGHRRSGSHGNPLAFTPSNAPTVPPRPVTHPGRGHRRIGSDEYSQIRSGSGTPTPRPASPAPMIGVPHVNTCPSNLNLASMMDTPIRPVPFKPTMGDGINRSVSWTSGIQQGSGVPSVMNDDTINLVSLSLDNQLQPLPPSTSSQESMDIYDEHCKLAEKYLHVQVEISLLMQRKHEVLKEFEQDEQKQQNSSLMLEELNHLTQENQSLKLLHSNLKKQTEQIRLPQKKRYGFVGP